jgi:hypothetical protein
MTAPRRLQLRRGNTAATSTYVGAAGELVVNTTTNTLYLHDGSTVGGYATTTNTSAINNQISSVNANITLANTGMQGYVNLANTIQSAQISAANIGIRGYVDATIAANIANIAVASTYSNVNVKAYTESMGYQNFGNVNVAAYVTTANSAIIGYIDLANTIQSAQVNAANLAITAANLGMKGYVDSVASQSIYGNGNVKSYLTQFDGNIVPSANVTFSLGNVTNRWKDLYLSGNTIFLGDATITTEGSRLVTTGVAISPPTGAVGFANVYYESPTDFAQIRSYYVDNNFGYTANLKSWTTAPIVWDSLRSAKIYHASLEFPDFDPLDTVGGRYANAVCTLDTTGNIASLTITDGGVGYDSYYPYYATDPTGYVYNSIGRSDEGAPQGIGFRRIDLVPTTASDLGNVAYLIRTGGSGGPTITRGPAAPTVGSNTYTWTGNSGSTFSITIDWTANTSTSFSYTPALPALTSAQEWQDWLLDYQAAYAGPTTDPLYPDYSAEAYLRLEAYPSILIYDITNAIWFLNVENPTFWQTLPGLPVNLSNNYFRVMIGGPALGYATLESGYGVPVYWLRGLTADSGISTGGDMTVAGDLRVAGDLYVSPTSIYMGNLRISAADGNLTVNTGIKFSDGSVQSSSYSNVQVGVFTNLSNYAYTANVTAANVGVIGYVDLANTIQSNQISAANLGMRGYVDNQITTITGGAPAILDTLGELANALGADANLSVTITSQIANVNANITTANLGMRGYVDSQSFYSNVKVATYLPTYDGNIAANISKAGYTWTFGTDAVLTLPSGATILESGYGSAGAIRLKPNGGTSTQYLEIAPTTVDGNHVHLMAGSGTELFLGDDNHYVKLANTGGVVINSNDSAGNTAQWTFGKTGTTQFPNSLILAPVSQSITMQSDQYSQLMWENANLTVAPNMAINSNFYVAQNNATLDIGYRDGSSTQLIKSWYWSVDGNLKLPSGGYILNSDDSIYGGGNYSNVQVETYLPTYSGNVANITLSPSGVITFADGTTQITAGGAGGTNYSNVNVAAYVTTNGLTNYSNVNVKAYTETMGFKNYSNVNVAAYLSTATINTTGNITAQNLIGNISITGNVTGTSANVTLQAGSYSSTFDNQGNVTVPKLFTAGNIQTAGYLFGNGTLLTGVAIKTTGSWTVPTGNSTQSFTVASGTYQLWVDCNIPNGILAWNATATVTNSNVPVVGEQYAWVYNGGGTPIDFTSIPNQFVGTGNTIVRSSVSPSVTTNRFDFGINNTSGGNVTVSYGYVKIS